jgi:hypothetical protein
LSKAIQDDVELSNSKLTLNNKLSKFNHEKNHTLAVIEELASYPN